MATSRGQVHRGGRGGGCHLLDGPDALAGGRAPKIRRYVFSRFPFVIYYRREPMRERATIYAVMHSSREPGYRHHRAPSRA